MGETKSLFFRKIAVIKMTILPKVMFLLQTIPVVNNVKQFEIWQKKINTFIWEGKRPHIKMKYLMDNNRRGGLQLPNLKIYQEAICLAWISEWLNY